MTVEEIEIQKYRVCCPMCDADKCIKGHNECDAETWAKQKMQEVEHESNRMPD